MGLWKQLCPDQRYCLLYLKQVQANVVVDQELGPDVLTDFLPDYGWGQGAQHIRTLEDQRPFVKFIHWSPQNVRQVLALVGTGAHSTLLQGCSHREYGGQTGQVR